MNNVWKIAYRVQIIFTTLAAVFFAAGLMAVGLTSAAQHRIVYAIAEPVQMSFVPKTIWDDQEVNRADKGDRLVDMERTPSPPETRARPFVVPVPWPWQTVVKEYEI